MPDFALLSDLPTKLSQLEQDIKYFGEIDIISENYILELIERVLTPPIEDEEPEVPEDPEAPEDPEVEEPPVKENVEFIVYVGMSLEDIKVIKGIHEPILNIVYC